MPRADRSGKQTLTGATQLFQSAKSQILPPLPLTDPEKIFFDWIISSREASTWSPNDLVIVVNLARTFQRLEVLNTALSEEGFTQENNRGTQVANPIFLALTQTQHQVQALSKTLGLSASQKGLAGDRQTGRNVAEREAKAVIDKVSSTDLLA
jgi:hypothetical protein